MKHVSVCNMVSVLLLQISKSTHIIHYSYKHINLLYIYKYMLIHYLDITYCFYSWYSMGSRKRGNPRSRFKYHIEEDFGKMNIRNWKGRGCNREERNRLLEQAKTCLLYTSFSCQKALWCIRSDWKVAKYS